MLREEFVNFVRKPFPKGELWPPKVPGHRELNKKQMD